jgi:trans-aconitate 2-methyltransferase
MAETTTWDPDQYLRFAAERRRPFDDLLATLTPVPGGRAVDLGCGTGELTVDLHRYLGAAETVGVDSSSAMLDRARALLAAEDGPDGLRFELGQLEDWRAEPSVDVVFANASLHWAPDHPALLAHLADQLAPAGQLAFQVPANHDHPSHVVATQLGTERGLDVSGGAATVLAPETYATLLHGLGLTDVDVVLRVYGFELPSAADVVEWTKGTLLTGYKAQLDDAGYADFEREYRDRLADEIGSDGPYYYAFKRILASGRRRPAS